MGPDPARLPGGAVGAGVGAVELVAAAGGLEDAQPGGDTRRAHVGIAVARVVGGNRVQLFGELGLTRAEKRELDQLDEVVVVLVEDKAALRVVEAAAIYRDI